MRPLKSHFGQQPLQNINVGGNPGHIEIGIFLKKKSDLGIISLLASIFSCLASPDECFLDLKNDNIFPLCILAVASLSIGGGHDGSWGFY